MTHFLPISTGSLLAHSNTPLFALVRPLPTQWDWRNVSGRRERERERDALTFTETPLSLQQTWWKWIGVEFTKHHFRGFQGLSKHHAIHSTVSVGEGGLFSKSKGRSALKFGENLRSSSAPMPSPNAGAAGRRWGRSTRRVTRHRGMEGKVWRSDETLEVRLEVRLDMLIWLSIVVTYLPVFHSWGW